MISAVSGLLTRAIITLEGWEWKGDGRSRIIPINPLGRRYELWKMRVRLPKRRLRESAKARRKASYVGLSSLSDYVSVCACLYVCKCVGTHAYTDADRQIDRSCFFLFLSFFVCACACACMRACVWVCVCKCVCVWARARAHFFPPPFLSSSISPRSLLFPSSLPLAQPPPFLLPPHYPKLIMNTQSASHPHFLGVRVLSISISRQSDHHSCLYWNALLGKGWTPCNLLLALPFHF